MKSVLISLKISIKFVHIVRFNNIPALVEIMDWRRPGAKPLSEPRIVSLLTHICITRPLWVNGKAHVLGCVNCNRYEQLLVVIDDKLWLFEPCIYFHERRRNIVRMLNTNIYEGLFRESANDLKLCGQTWVKRLKFTLNQVWCTYIGVA